MKKKSIWDHIAPSYSKKPIADLPAYEEKLARVSSLLNATDSVLEIGCGTGSTALLLAPNVAHITGTDSSRGMIQIAQSKLGADAPTNVRFHLADAAERVEGHPFDVICAFSLLHLIKDVSHALEKIRQQVKPGGLFISKTECLKDKGILLQILVSILVTLKIAPTITPLGANSLTQLLHDAGFEIEGTSYFGSNTTNLFVVARRPAL